MHKRLADQLGQATRADGSVDWAGLLEQVGRSYADWDRAQLDTEKAEQDLREKEAFFQDLFDSVSDWSWETDAGHQLTYASEPLGSALGAKSSALLGFSWFELGLNELPELAARHRADLAARSAFRDLAFPVGPLGGKDRRTIRISGIPKYEDGRFVGYRGVGTDVTREAAAELRAKAAQQQLVDAIESIEDAIALFDAEDRLVICNSSYHRLVDPGSEFLEPGMTFETLLRAAQARGVIDLEGQEVEAWLVDRVARHRKAGRQRFIVKMADGRWFQSSENPTQEGGVISVRTDVTLLENQQRGLEQLVEARTAELRREVEVRTRAEAALRWSRERLKGITDNIFEGVVVVDRFGQLIFGNRSARQLLGCDPGADFEGFLLDDLFSLGRQNRIVRWAESPWQRVLAEGITLRDDDAVFVTAAGQTLSVAYACSPLGEDGQRRAAIISFRDISSLKQAQCEALQSSRLASVGQLAAGIAHEINTPIQYVGDNLAFLRKSVEKLSGALDPLLGPEAGPPDETMARFASAAAKVKLAFLLKEMPVAIGEALDGVAQIARIVLSMKEFSHPGSNAKTMTDINRALESTLTVSRNVWKNVAELNKALDPDLPPVLCHAGEMNQVFLNLIVNAAQAIEASGKPLPGRIAVSTRRDADHVVISISDSGTGVPVTIRDKIFDPFFTTKDVGKGTGQGLAICRDVVVTKHSGSLSVDGEEGQGAVFTVRLPIEGSTPDERDGE